VKGIRASAIALVALRQQRPVNLVLIAVKATKDYQILGTTKITSTDREEAQQRLHQRPLIAPGGGKG